jgi:hypothetical protein
MHCNDIYPFRTGLMFSGEQIQSSADLPRGASHLVGRQPSEPCTHYRLPPITP